MDYQQMTSPCGIDCFNCPAYLANKNEKLRTMVARHLDVPFEQAICNGCRNENGRVACHNMTETCHVYKCTEKKNIKFCCDCSDSRCNHLHSYADKASQRPHNTKVFNLCLIKKMGLESWAQTKAKSVRDTYFNEKFKL
jgi:hypothetical protein